MPRYKFIGAFETVLHGLAHDVNALLHREEHGQPAQSTVVVQPGDEVETAETYPHALMVNLATGVTDLEAAVKEAPAAVDELAAAAASAEKKAAAAAKRAAKAAEKAAASAAVAAVTDPATPATPAVPPSDPAPAVSTDAAPDTSTTPANGQE